MDGYGLDPRASWRCSSPSRRRCLLARSSATHPGRAIHTSESLTNRRPTPPVCRLASVGFAAALTETRCATFHARPATALVVELEHAAGAAAAPSTGQPVRVPGEVRTRAEMLACGLSLCAGGESSSRARGQIRRWSTKRIFGIRQQSNYRRSEGPLSAALRRLPAPPASQGCCTPSSSESCARLHQLDEESCVLLVITEGAPPSAATIFGTS